MNRVLRLVLPVTFLLVFGAFFVHPYGTIRQKQSNGPLFMGAEAPPEVAHIFERACQNCHSERTEWPWYSYVAPMSWMIEKDVNTGRSHMNLSHWQDYTVEEQIDLLTRLAVQVRNRKMPLPKYLKIHPEARLSDDDLQQLDSWAHRERKRLRSGEAKGKASTD